MSEPSSLSDANRYERACDQAIAMCDGNLRSTIKALIMANEYLEAELEELQAAVAAGCAPASQPRPRATPPDRGSNREQRHGRCHLLRGTTVPAGRQRLAVRRGRGRMPEYDRLQAVDMMQNAVIVASFAYHAANRDLPLPRKPLPAPPRQQAPSAQ